jgi:hypothetical protein
VTYVTLTGAFLSKHEMANKRLYATCFIDGAEIVAISLFRETPPNLEAVRDMTAPSSKLRHSIA